MKELLKQAFQAGRDFGHAMGTGRPTYGLTFDEWYSKNENQALSSGDVVKSCPHNSVTVYLHEHVCNHCGAITQTND